MQSSGKRTRGPNKQAPWSRDPAEGVSVLRLPVDVSDPRQRARLASMFRCAYALRRAVQRDARSRCRAYWAATHERADDPAAVRTRLGLSRDALEDAAFDHVNRAPHLRRFVTKALAQAIADNVWVSAQRHLFCDASGRRHGAPRVGRYLDFTRLPGRARSHTTEHKWETARLHGTLVGHRAAYTNRAGDFVQPRHLRAVRSKNWWRHDGSLVVVFSGLADGTLVLPVRLPTAPANQAHLEHHLADPSRWHKIDLVRRRDPHARGGWRYEAHLMVLTQPYVSPRTAARRARVAIDTAGRQAGIDVNVSNVTIASHDAGGAMRLTTLERDAPAQERDVTRRKRERRRQRALERSRRANNRAQYELSRRQQKHARRRAAAGLPPVAVIPMGARKARADGVPVQRYRHDELSRSFRRHRAGQVAEAHAASQARRDRARAVAADVVATHGHRLITEDVRIAAWASRWGRAVAAFSPGILVSAIERESRSVAALVGGTGGVERAATSTTALSQHCPCGARVTKRLADRIHVCTACGLRGDRDAVAAVLASFVVVTQPGEPTSAQVDYEAARQALAAIRHLVDPSAYQGWQDTLSESTDLCARDGFAVSWWTSTPDIVAVARRNAGRASCSTLDETGARQTTSDRARVRTRMSRKHGPPWTDLRDTS